MEKGKSSRLKRKTTSKAKKDDTKIRNSSSTDHLRNIEKVQPIVLSSESEEECGQSRPKQRNATKDNLTTNPKCSGVPDETPSSLQKLKKLLCSLASEDTVNHSTFKPYPPHSQSLNGETEKSTHKKGTLLLTAIYPNTEELSPFPKPCKACMRISRYHDKTNCHRLLMENVNSNSEMKDVASEEIEKKVIVENDNICKSNDNNHVSIKPLQGTENCDSNVRKLSSNNNSDGTTSRSEHVVNNSHLMRDRNANLYSLQSRNQTRNIPTNTFNSGKVVSNSSNTNVHSAIVKHTTSGSTNSVSLSHTPINSDVSNQRNNATNANSKLSCDKSAKKGKQLSPHPNERGELLEEQNLNQSYTKIKDQFVVSGDQSALTKMMQSCPMCQKDFPNGTSQLDIDSHLAACLSSADDDFNW